MYGENYLEEPDNELHESRIADIKAELETFRLVRVQAEDMLRKAVEKLSDLGMKEVEYQQVEITDNMGVIYDSVSSAVDDYKTFVRNGKYD